LGPEPVRGAHDHAARLVATGPEQIEELSRYRRPVQVDLAGRHIVGLLGDVGEVLAVLTQVWGIDAGTAAGGRCRICEHDARGPRRPREPARPATSGIVRVPVATRSDLQL